MKLSYVWLIALLVLGLLGACEKTSDLVPMAEEAHGMLENFKPRIAELDRRAKSLAARAIALDPSDANAASPTSLYLRETQRQIRDLQQIAQQGTGSVQTAVNNNKSTGNSEPLAKVMNETRIQLTNGYTEVNSRLDAVDSFLTIAESKPRVAAAEPPAPANPTSQEGPMPPPAATQGSGATPPTP